MRTYYTIVDAEDRPATARQRRLHGTRQYGYATLWQALHILNRWGQSGWAIVERHEDGWNDWAGRTLTVKS